MLTELEIRDSYASDEDDIVNEFYNPVLERAVSYDRITGYFAPNIFAIAARGFAGIITNGGKIRLLSSIQVTREVHDAIKSSENPNLNTDIFTETGINFNPDSLQTQLEKDYLKVFMYLYKKGSLELKVAVLTEKSGILHQKVGVVRDSSGNAISFSGSNNETAGGVANNLEEFKVFKNWTISSASWYARDEAKFEKYWENKVEGVEVVAISDAIKAKLIEITDLTEDIDVILRRIKAHEQKTKGQKTENKPERDLRDYQIEAIQHWIDNGYKSIFEMATGTGKTFTAINALKKFKTNNSYLRVIAVVPLTTLTVQWEDDIKKILPDINVINTSTNNKWKDELNSIILSRKLGRDIDYVLVTTYSMFSKEEFEDRISKLGDDLILLADEMHNLVNSNRIRALASPIYKYKLGLSATPTRLWQQTESGIARLHFGNNSYQYSLEDAIKNGFLVPYNYHPLPVQFSLEEYEEYLELSKEIARMSQINNDEKSGNSALHMKLIARSRIKKNAESKLLSLEKTLRIIQKNDGIQNTLIYVDNEEYIHELQEMLTQNNIRTTRFIGNNTLEERLSAIENLRTHSINAIVAIKCLDEGVDIPSAKTAFFISNNTDPREYVQRLGRVLRLDDESKKDLAEIYDYIVMPPLGTIYESDMDRRIARNMIKNELIRSRFFNELALNSAEAKDIIDDAVDRYGFYYENDELTYSIGDEDNEPTY